MTAGGCSARAALDLSDAAECARWRMADRGSERTELIATGAACRFEGVLTVGGNGFASALRSLDDGERALASLAGASSVVLSVSSDDGDRAEFYLLLTTDDGTEWRQSFNVPRSGAPRSAAAGGASVVECSRRAAFAALCWSGGCDSFS